MALKLLELNTMVMTALEYVPMRIRVKMGDRIGGKLEEIHVLAKELEDGGSLNNGGERSSR
jgi:hypothetical protein